MKAYIRKWYEKLKFPSEYDRDFEAALNTVTGLCEMSVNDYVTTEELRLQNFMMYLYFCEALEKKYAEKSIPKKILFDTLSDLVIWAKTNYSVVNSLGICEPTWTRRHLAGELFRLGRLQFAFGKCEEDIDAIGVKKGDKVLEVHIPEGQPLSFEECEKSFNRAKVFFAEFFPEYDYKCFTCYSWLLGDTLKNFLPENSNILKFQNRFTRIRSDESYAILKYTFAWNARKHNLESFESKTAFAEKIKSHVLSGGKFYETYGYIPR